MLNKANEINKQKQENKTFNELLEQASSIHTKTNSYGRHYNNLVKLPKTASEMRFYIHNNNKQLVGATVATSPIKHGYTENNLVKHYRRASTTTIYPHELIYLAKQSNGDINEFRKLVRKRVGFAMANSEIEELIHRATKNKPSECMCAVIEQVEERVNVYTK